MWFRAITARPAKARMRCLRNVLGEAFVDPGRHAFGIKSMHDEVRDFVTERVVSKLEARIAQNEQASARMNSAGPFFETADLLELHPVFRRFENVDVRFRIARLLFAVECLCHDAVVKLRFNGDRRRDEAMTEVIDEMLAFRVLPLLRMNRERLLAEGVQVTLA